MKSSKLGRAALATVLLAVATALLGYRLLPLLENGGETGQPVRADGRSKPPGVPDRTVVRAISVSSPREEKDRALFMELAGSHRADILVLPVTAPQAVSLDRTARALMQLRLARAIAERAGSTVADPGIVARALGAMRRDFEPDRVKRLADALGAKWVVSTEVSRPVADIPEDTPLVFSLAIRCAPPGELAASRPLLVQDISFSDDLPPEEVFLAQLDGIVEQLPIGLHRPPSERVREAALTGVLPKNPFELTQTVRGSPLEHALRLQLLSTLHMGGESRDQLLLERSILALDTASSDSPDYRVLRAYAASGLGRRPHALAVLGPDRGAAERPQERAMRALLDGNLPALIAAAPMIELPAMRLMFEVQAERVRMHYGQSAGYIERRSQILSRLPRYEPLLRLSLSAEDWATPEAPYLIARHLMQIGVPVEGDGGNRLELFLRAVERALDLRQRGDYDLAPAAAIERSFASLWKTDLHKLVAEGLGPQPVPFDYFELLQEINRTAALKGAEVAWKQGRPRAGLAAMDTLEAAIPACAEVVNTRVEILNQLASEAASANGESPAAELARRLAAEAYQWEGGETPESAVAYKLSGYAVEVRYLDEPPPRFRSWTDDETLRMSGSDQQAIERWLRRNLRGLGYEERGASVLSEIENNLRLLGRSDEFEAILQANAHRYVGSRTRVDVLARRAIRNGDAALEERLRREAVQANPDAWQGYLNLAWVYAMRRDMAAAQRTLLAYPQFHGPSYRPVELGNEALEGIWMLRHAGEPELAWPLLELCAGLDTGSAAQMRCQELMAVLRGDYASAENHALRNYQRYPGYDTPASYIVYRFMLGRQTEAWAAFDQWSSRGYSESMQPVAVLGEQLQGGSDADIAAAAARWPLREAHAEQVGWRRDERLFRALFPDRVASTDTIQLLQRSASSSSNAKFWVDLAKGYLAFQGRDYQGALEAWRGPDQHLTEQSYQHDRSMNFLIPYIALAYALGSTSGSSDERLSGYAARFPDSDEAYAIETIRAATAGRPQAASEAAWKAFLYGGYSATQAIHGRLVLFEILEALLEHTRDDRYRELLVDLATRHTRFEQDAFAYAFMAKYTRSDADRQGALARALFLNRQSIRLKEFSDAQRREAGAWQAARGPSDRP